VVSTFETFESKVHIYAIGVRAGAGVRRKMNGLKLSGSHAEPAEKGCVFGNLKKKYKGLSERPQLELQIDHHGNGECTFRVALGQLVGSFSLLHFTYCDAVRFLLRDRLFVCGWCGLLLLP
jgi:hypothetical protein